MNEIQTSPGISVLFYILVCETWCFWEWTGSAKVGDGLPRLPDQKEPEILKDLSLVSFNFCRREDTESILDCAYPAQK